jgi:hypothetical protein
MFVISAEKDLSSDHNGIDRGRNKNKERFAELVKHGAKLSNSEGERKGVQCPISVISNRRDSASIPKARPEMLL